ncbi:HAD-IIB family hydrolase [Thiorhodovibrio frisius]|uniref:HAD-superfamily hydrolase, subfamily IIB n=1 Tax=Thiorhodovibrio frisius TaxID=631362 RepID=H8Z0K9_9GAMM|nr:HAD-IIB family hydrolase [Thiorhodovibrio frisius]EIC22350.1 HAD-superfamily hydrolase, subfamily IIB [Thiorhodovibrio frisius]WPL24649.1 Mannosylfructose-phosphate phosphatase [Thiorhodovibrio frisius]
MKALATDLDRTLLPNGRWEADPQAIELFNRLTREQDTYVIYVTGRSLALTEQAIAEFGIRHPHVLIGDVGTTIREYRDGHWSFDDDWIAHVRAQSPRWDVAGIKNAVTEIDGLSEQPPENLNPFKQSYFVDHDRSDAILELVDERVKGHFDESAIYSFDSQSGEGLLDFLPKSANKQTALEFVAAKLGLEKSAVVFCGDSGNDVFPLTAGFSGVLVRNADEQLVSSVKQAQAASPDLKVYFAQGGFQGLSGYYTSGVIEGACHYGVLDFPAS